VTHLRKRMLEELQRRNYSEGTTRAYLQAVQQFAVHFGKSPDKLGPDDLRSYQAYLLVERKLAVASVVARVAALRFFFVRTLKRREFREELPYPKSYRRLPTVLSLEEVARLIDGAGNLMQRALLMTLYGTGMRRTEVSMLKVRDIDSRRMMIRVERGKGGASRDLPLSPALLETLREYWRWKKPRVYLFPSSIGQRDQDRPISDKTVWYACKEAARHARITKHVTPHTLRHSWLPICSRRERTCGRSRFCLATKTWKPPPSIFICRSGTYKQYSTRWRVYNSPALARQAAAIIGRKVNWCGLP
jgi:integrase/recombinase XerD